MGINFSSWKIFSAAALMLALVALILFRIFFVSFVDNYEIGYRFDRVSGEITILDRSGYFIRRPFVESIQAIDGRPVQVCINANARVLNCKLVQFNPEGIELFLAWHGRNFNSSPAALSEILKSYAYDGSGRTYPFLTILRELRAEDDPSWLRDLEG